MSWLRRLISRDSLERDLDKELRFHVDAATADLIRGGMPPGEARRVARLELGGVEQVKEASRDSRGTRWVEDFVTDVRHALRGMRRAPALSAAAILTLAIGIGANTSVWSIADALMRRSLPVARPEELYVIQRTDKDDESLISHPTMQRMRAALPDSSRLAGMSTISRLYATISDQPEGVLVQLVSGNWFSLLGVPAQRGRLIGPGDDRVLGGAPVAIISENFWERRFARDSTVIGRTMRIGGTALTIIGVSRSGFSGLTVGTPVDVFAPLTMQHELQYRGNAMSSNANTEKPWVPQNGVSWLILIARALPDEVAATTARLERPFRAALVEVYADRDSADRAYAMREHVRLAAIPRGFSPLREQFGDPLRILMISVALILLITCANLAGLLLARSAARAHEIALRVSLGALSGRLVRQALTESLTMAAIGGLLSLAVAQWSTGVLLKLASTGTRPIPLDTALDARVLAFAFGLTLLAGILFGLAPALRAARTDLSATFKAGGRVIAGQRSHRLPLGRALVMGQVALSLILVTSAGVFVRTFQNLVKIDVGYERERLVTARLDVRAAGFTYDQLPALHARLLAALRGVPGARSASLSRFGLAWGGRQISGFNPPGRKIPPGENQGQENYVTPDFFRTVGIQLVSGRAFTEQDAKGTQRVVILNQTAARRFLGTDSVVGKRFGYDSDQPWMIVGVVRDARVNSLRESAPPVIFSPLAQAPQEYLTSAEVRVSGNPTAVIAGIRNALSSVDRKIPVRDIVTMETLLERGLSRERMVARLATGFGILALLLAAIGLYGVISYSVARRTNEMGVRLALGATPADVSWVVLRDSLVTIVLGLATGVLLWLPVLGVAQSLVYGLSPHDPASLAGGALLLFAVGLLAALLPARRASRIDPIEAIRAE